MKSGDLVLFRGDGGRFDVRIGSIGLVLAVRKDQYRYSRGDFLFDALLDGKIVRGILNNDWQEVVSGQG